MVHLHIIDYYKPLGDERQDICKRVMKVLGLIFQQS